MKDTIIKQTGNSRTLKTSLPAGTSWEEALAMLRAGTFPIDILGLVVAGLQQLGTDLTKETLLTDDTAAALGLSGDPTVDQALNTLANGLKVAGSKYSTCSTASGTAAKAVTLSGFTLSVGALVAVKFSNINTAASPTLNVGSTGAKAIYDCRTGTYPKLGALINATHLFVYNGTQWVLLNPTLDFDLLESLDWATVGTLSTNNVMSSLFAVGDCKSVTLNGTAGARTFSNEKTYAFILSFAHNTSVEGSGKTHWQFGKTAAKNGVDAAFTDSKYNSNGSDAAFRMNTTNTNSGGWNNSYMKKTIIPAFKNCLPAALKSALKSVTKWTDNTGGGSDTAGYVTSTTEDLFLLAEFEIHGARTYANSAEKTKQAQYAYYANGNSKIKYRDTDLATACYWWTRSPNATNATYFCNVSTNGNATNYSAYYSHGFAPGFCV